MNKSLYLCGAGNPEGVRLAIRINEHEQRWSEIRILDDDPEKKGTQLLGIEVIGPFDTLGDVSPESAEVVNLVARTTRGRDGARQAIARHGVPFTPLVHPGVDLLGAEIGQDIIVYRDATISAGSTIGEGSVVFGRAIVGHGATLGKCCVVAPGAVINARVQVEDRAYVGTNSSVLPEVRIGEAATVAANTAVVQDVPAGAMVIGVPGEVISPHSQEVPSATRPAERRPRRSPDRSANDPTRARIEAAILEVWRGILENPSLSRTDNFFDGGGTSLLAVQAIDRIKTNTSRDLCVVDLFRFPTAQSLSGHLQGSNGTHGSTATVDLATAGKRRMRRRRV